MVLLPQHLEATKQVPRHSIRAISKMEIVKLGLDIW